MNKMHKIHDLFLLPSQIQEGCKLALPDGLKELMSDITREVLRYQPRELYKFIADYLSALLITRDNLSVASYICNDIYQCGCEPELICELRDLGVPECEINTARDIIMDYFEKGPVQESSLLLSLIKDTSITEDMMPAVQEAIRAAFIRHQAHNTTKYESSSDSEKEELMCAAKHTLDLYKKTGPSEQTYEIMADKIQKSYRAYGVKRDCKQNDDMQEKKKSADTSDTSLNLNEPTSSIQKTQSYDTVFPHTKYSEEVMSQGSLPEELNISMSSSKIEKRLTTISSVSLAGSFVTLPSYRPYSVHDFEVLSDLDEFPEKEHAIIDYTVDNPHISLVTEDKQLNKRGKKISFCDEEIKIDFIDHNCESDNDTLYPRKVDNDDNSSDQNEEHFDEISDNLDEAEAEDHMDEVNDNN